jgi:hypothetical protein
MRNMATPSRKMLLYPGIMFLSSPWKSGAWPENCTTAFRWRLFKAAEKACPSECTPCRRSLGPAAPGFRSFGWFFGSPHGWKNPGSSPACCCCCIFSGRVVRKAPIVHACIQFCQFHPRVMQAPRAADDGGVCACHLVGHRGASRRGRRCDRWYDGQQRCQRPNAFVR